MDCKEELDTRPLAGVAASKSLRELVAALRATVRSDDIAGVGSVLRSNQIENVDFMPLVSLSRERYTRTLLYRNDDLELLLIYWPLGVVSPVHDHGASRCFLRVVHGSLLADDYKLVAGGQAPGFARVALTGTTLLRRGDVDVRNKQHDLHRVAAYGSEAVSLHVYTKPLERCLIFDAEQNRSRLSISRYDTTQMIF